MPQPDESITRPFAAKNLARVDHRHARGKSPKTVRVIPWHQARQYVGHKVIVEGKVVHTGVDETGSVRFLNFDRDWHDNFYIAIFSSANRHWPEPAEKYCLHKTIRIRGTVKTHRDRPQIGVSKPSQITIVADHGG